MKSTNNVMMMKKIVFGAVFVMALAPLAIIAIEEVLAVEMGEHLLEHLREVNGVEMETSFITHNNETEIVVVVVVSSIQEGVVYEDEISEVAEMHGYNNLVFERVDGKLYLIFVEAA